MGTDTRYSKLAIIEQREAWNNTVSNFRQFDVYYTYEYCHWTAKLENGQAKLIFFENEWGSVIYPIIIRPITSHLGGQFYDITSPYGYGGPLVSKNELVLKEFASVFQTYCLENHIVSEVIRLHPLLKNADYLGDYCKLKYVRKTTAIDLMPDLQDIRSTYSSMNKRNIKKAFKHNLQCRVVEKNIENIEIFLDLYKTTMDRKNADDYYYFNYAIFKDQLIDTAFSKSYLLFVFYGEKVISAVLLLTSKDLAHYHLGASDKEYLDLRPNNLIFDFMVQYAKEKGCKLLHLGGGYQENDSLFEFKSSFTNGNHFNFMLGMNIYNMDIYEELVKQANSQSVIKEGFFPLYRSI